MNLTFCKMALALHLLAAAALYAQTEKWDNTITVQGRGVRQTCVFPVVGEKWRLRYAPKSRSNVKIEMLDENGEVLTTMINYRNLDMAWTANGRRNEKMKNVALRIEGDVNGWSCTFEQYVDAISGWPIYKWHNDLKTKQMEKFAMWTGDAGDEIEIPVAVEARRWKLCFDTFDAGKVKLELVDQSGKCHFLNYHLDKGHSDGWVFAPGEYTLKVSSIGSDWAAAIEVEKDLSNAGLVK